MCGVRDFAYTSSEVMDAVIKWVDCKLHCCTTEMNLLREQLHIHGHIDISRTTRTTIHSIPPLLC